ncbi:MAG: DUF2259 domain-containing protein [Halothece sp.]
MRLSKRLLILFGVFATSPLFLTSEALAEIFKTSHKLSGFSTDSEHYIYVETAQDPVSDEPQGYLQIVDVANNSCVSNGCIDTDYLNASSSSSSEAANELLEETAYLRYQLKLNNPSPGRRLAAIAHKSDARGVDIYDFRLPNGEILTLRMLQRSIPSVVNGGDAPRDQAALGLDVTHNWRTRTLSSLNNYREGIIRYKLREVRLAPNGKNAVIIFNVIRPASMGAMQGTLVQSFAL